MEKFSKGLDSMLKTESPAAAGLPPRRRRSARAQASGLQGNVYDIIFMLSGVLALIGGGIVNVNIQLATLKERVREVGVKMAIGAPGREIFKEFMTEALLLTACSARSPGSSSASAFS